MNPPMSLCGKTQQYGKPKYFHKKKWTLTLFVSAHFYFAKDNTVGDGFHDHRLSMRKRKTTYVCQGDIRAFEGTGDRSQVTRETLYFMRSRAGALG